MFRNYLKVAIRNLLRNKTFAAINIGGVAVGLTAFWLISLYVADELSYDRFHVNADRIVRVAQHSRWDGNSISQATTSAPFAAALQAEFPEIQQATRIVPEGGGILKYNEKALQADDVVFTDNNIFDVFTYPFLYGNKATALMRPQCIVLTEGLARKLFGNPAKAVNKTVYFENNYPNEVTGVIKDIPENSQLHFTALRSLPENYTSGWQNFNSYTYLLLKEGTSYKSLENKMPQWAKKTIQKMMGIDDYRIELQPLTSIHLHSDLQFDIGANSNMNRLYIFIAIAALILIIAIINYMNLSTARSAGRVKEVGVRKVLGSGRSRLIKMFVTEALVMTFIAACISFVLVTSLLPWFNTLAEKHLTIWRFGSIYTLLSLTGFVLLTGIVSGSYPALFLSRFKIIPSLKGEMGNLSGSVVFRKSLVVFQFSITVIMIAGSLIIYRQMQYVAHKDLGFNKEQVLTFHIHDREARSQTSAMKAQLLQNPLIQGAAVCGNPIGDNNIGTNGFVFERPDGSFSNSTKLAEELMVDEDYIPTMDIQLLAGRNFSPLNGADKYTAALVNETLADDLGWKEPIGKRIRFTYGDGETGERTVVGVVKDFHTFSLQHKVEPMVLLMPPVASMQDNLYVKINTSKTPEALAYINKVYQQFDKSNPTSFRFLDENFARQYTAEQKQEQLSLVFTILAVLIACLGLFGLAAFTARQRVKEIGIRKVLGASVSSITIMLGKTYVKLVLVSIGIGVPVAWFIMNKWLQDFAYRIHVSWREFALAGAVALFIAIITVSIQAIKAAIANPVKSLRAD